MTFNAVGVGVKARVIDQPGDCGKEAEAMMGPRSLRQLQPSPRGKHGEQAVAWLLSFFRALVSWTDLREGKGVPVTRSADLITRCSLAWSLAAAAGNQVMMECVDGLNDSSVKLSHDGSRQGKASSYGPFSGGLWYSADTSHPRR